MSKIEQLLKKLCPDGVEYKPLGECYTRLRGTPITAAKMKEIAEEGGEVRIFAGGKTVVDAHESDIPAVNITRVPAVLVQSRGVIDFVYYDRPFTFKNEMWAYTADNQVSVKFLYYLLQNNAQYFRDAASGMGSLPQISLRVTEDFLIPLPPIEIQREVVEILDKFAQLEAELEAELAKRKKQYEHYRRALLAGNAGASRPPNEELRMKNEELRIDSSSWPRVKLGEVCEILDSERRPVTKKDRISGDIPYYGANGVQDYVKDYLFDGEFLLVGEDGSVINKDNSPVINWASGKIWVNNHAHILKESPKALLRYLFYSLQIVDVSGVVRGTPPKLNQQNLRNISLPLPPLAEQERIVAILDRFDSLCNSLSEGLPAEIERRKKQYAFYRDKLLTFPKRN